jgi:hypothetical protein
MTHESFNAWRLLINRGKERPLSERETAELLGCSRVAVRNWSKTGAPRYIGLACSAILHGLPAWEKH